MYLHSLHIPHLDPGTGFLSSRLWNILWGRSVERRGTGGAGGGIVATRTKPFNCRVPADKSTHPLITALASLLIETELLLRWDGQWSRACRVKKYHCALGDKPRCWQVEVHSCSKLVIKILSYKSIVLNQTITTFLDSIFETYAFTPLLFIPLINCLTLQFTITSSLKKTMSVVWVLKSSVYANL